MNKTRSRGAQVLLRAASAAVVRRASGFWKLPSGRRAVWRTGSPLGFPTPTSMAGESQRTLPPLSHRGFHRG